MTSAPDVSYLIVNSNQRELLLACLDSVLATAPPLAYEILVLDNCSRDGSGAAVRERYGDRVKLFELDRRQGKAENDTHLLETSRGRYALLLNADTELLPGAVAELHAALEAHSEAGAAGAKLILPNGAQQPSAWRFPSLGTALAGAAFLHRLYTVQSRGDSTRTVDWVQSAAMLARREAFEQVGGLDPQFFVYSDEVDWQRRMRAAGWSVLYVPGALVRHHEMLSSDPSPARIVEFARNRDLYMRKHHGRLVASVFRLLTAWAYAARAAVALPTSRRNARRYWLHARRSLLPGRGEGLREKAARFNQGRA